MNFFTPGIIQRINYYVILRKLTDKEFFEDQHKVVSFLN